MMRKIQNLFNQRLLFRLKIPDYIRQEFLQESVRKNNFLFRAIMAPLLGAGDRLNLTITFVVALAVSLAHAHHAAVMLKQQKQIVEINAKLQELARLDPLTGLLNTTTVECRAEQRLHSLEYAEKTGGRTLFLVDLDEFKKINDCYGHRTPVGQQRRQLYRRRREPGYRLVHNH